MKDIKKSIICCAAVCYPLLKISLSFFGDNDGLMVLYFGISMALIVTCLFKYKDGAVFLAGKKTLPCLGLILINVWIFLLESNMYASSQCMIFSVAILIWLVVTSNGLSVYCLIWLKKKRYYIFLIRTFYYIVIIGSVVRGDGINNRHWETFVLTGPYASSHLLAYEVLLWVLVDAIYIINEKRKKYLIFLIIDSGIIVLTAARSILIPLVMVYYFILKDFKVQKRILMITAAGILGILLLRYTSIFTGLIEKTDRAIRTSTITSGRGMIFISSLKAYYEAPLSYKVFGMGINKLGEYNLKHIWMDVHAHNDYIDALVQYGIAGIAVYVYSFAKMIGKNKSFIAAALILAMAFFNGFYVNDSAMLGTVLFLGFNESVVLNKKKKAATINL